ncbi:unnamed protein product [Mytilus coruscus]|uniref:Uncharacterized protein n=1 Tax=Mytilus coruscus TaxID=42192 RepID=A0A6J8C0G7_MYTCO|nr:unnamed protein product [Mytilus coruscus]
MIADQDKKSLQQDMKKQLSDVQSQCSEQLTAKTEELKEVLDPMQKSKDKLEQELQYVKSEEHQRYGEIESTLETERKEFQQHIMDMQHQMKQEIIQSRQKHEESFCELKAEREMLMNKIEEQARIIDNDRSSSRYRNEGPVAPKLATFDGKSEWKPYYLQFIHIANKYNWDKQLKLDKLIECLRDKALKFYSTRPPSTQDDFRLLSDKLNQRFGNKDLQLQDVR